MNYGWRQEQASVDFNPFQHLTLDQLLEASRLEGSDLSDITSHSKYRLFAEVNGQPVGFVCLKEINLTMMTAEIGYVLGEKYYGQGLGGKMVALFLNQVFALTPLRRIEAIINVKNIPSVKLAEKLNFVREGLLREHYILNGKPADNYLYALLKNEVLLV